ncbi:Tol-Pal system beta propeller repeat protein TolB [Nevskia sp.]|uniref:Tol-Pal system beta propeller repeat protein TolB n=1 Tax=Nevskia sp. TaxID=1929292 RepID=UPI0025CC64DA|nr:Tol-Pal system beta propeller repeat protein TolB [Nevskia sp.]
MFKPMLAACLMLSGLAAHADLDITVVGGAKRAQPIAVVPFQQGPGQPADVAAIVAADLDRSGQFLALARNDMKGFDPLPTTEAQVDYRTWRALGQEALVIGNVQALPGGGAKTVAELYDVFRTQKILTVEATATRASEWRSMSHKIADQIYEKLTGTRGVFDTRIAYITSTMASGRRQFKLIWADADGENPREIARSFEPLLSPSWSPDGKRIAYVTFEGGRSKIIIQTPATGDYVTFLGEKGINSAPAWTPDGNRLVVTLSFQKNSDLYVIDLASKSRRRLTDSFAIDTSPTVSADGRTVAFLSDRSGSAQVYTMSIDGGDAKRVSFEGRRNEQPRFSPDGKTLALVNYDGSGYRIGLVDVATGALRLVSSGPLDEGPSFAPNSAVVIYTRQGAAGAELATVSTDGSVRQRLRHTGDVREPAWAPFAKP